MSNMVYERSKGCIAIETGIAAIYRGFARMFPEAKDFWSNLAMEEENHAAILTIAAEYEKRGRLPVSLAPRSWSQIRETLELLSTVRKSIEGANVSLQEALEIALRLEAATREYHLLQVKASETNSVILAALQSLAIDNGWHVQKIDSFLRGRLSS
jgi:rubrerythrin